MSGVSELIWVEVVLRNAARGVGNGLSDSLFEDPERWRALVFLARPGCCYVSA